MSVRAYGEIFQFVILPSWFVIMYMLKYYKFSQYDKQSQFNMCVLRTKLIAI